MHAILTNDFQYPHQYGCLRVEDCPRQDGEPVIFIQRIDDQLFLTADGHWRSAMEALSPVSTHWENDTLTCRLPLDMLKDMDSLAQYCLFINSSDTLCPMMLPEEISIPVNGKTGAVDEVLPQGQKTPEPELPAGNAEPVNEAVETPPIEDEHKGTEMTPEDTSKVLAEKKSPAVLIIVTVILLALAGGAAWYFLSSGDKAADSPPQTEQPAQPVQAETPEAALDEPAATPSAPMSGLETARKLLRDGASADKLLAEADALLTPNASADNQDAAFLLYEEAANDGDARAMNMLARFYDPCVNMERGSIETDPGMALAWYEKAVHAGSQEASQGLNSLKAWLKEQAATGSREAQDLLDRL